MSLAQIYYTVTPCCESSGSSEGFFNFPDGTSAVNGTFKYNGVSVTINGITFDPGFCYTFSPLGIAVPDYPVLPEITEFSATKSCSNPLCYDCTEPLPAQACFNLYSCDGVNIVTNTDLTQHVNTFVNVTSPSKFEGCYYVSQTDIINCQNTETVDVVISEEPCDCECYCYQITGNPSSVYYVDCNLVEHTVIGSVEVCSVIPPIVRGGLSGNIYQFDTCNEEGVCAEHCFEFTNCQTGETLIVSNTQQVTEYFVNNSVVVLNGYEGCWTIDLSLECDCPVNVTVLQAYDSCTTCLPIIAYKFTNCDNQAIIQYSTDDYSDYVGKTVRLECGGCWFVTQIDYTPPATQPIVIEHTFDSCLACSRDYYVLTDCVTELPFLYTYTDLSAYVNSIIKIENCTGCYVVAESTAPVDAVEVVFAQEFENCEECQYDYPCLCSVGWPNAEGIIEYIDCNNQLVSLSGQDPNTELKTCVKKWITVVSPIFYEACTSTSGSERLPVYSCPVNYPKRFIKPGYTTIGCDPEKYEKYSCKAAELLYKSALEKRYGISNCCPDTDMGDKWLVKKELADLQGATDPNYTCKPSTSCCTHTPTCGCGCNSRSNTWNS